MRASYRQGFNQFGWWVFILILAACQSTAADHLRSAARQVKAAPEKSALVGQVVWTASNEPVGDMPVSLAQVFWNEDKSDGAYVLTGAYSPGDMTDEWGVFVVENVTPGDYVLVVGNPIGFYTVLLEPNGKARILSLKPGEVLEFGVVDIEPPK